MKGKIAEDEAATENLRTLTRTKAGPPQRKNHTFAIQCTFKFVLVSPHIKNFQLQDNFRNSPLLAHLSPNT
jgi:hypothetical protein